MNKMNKAARRACAHETQARPEEKDEPRDRSSQGGNNATDGGNNSNVHASDRQQRRGPILPITCGTPWSRPLA